MTSDQFQRKKQHILARMALDSPDASPKGYIDEEILPLVEELNKHKSIVTTSSCAGRIAVFLEGVKTKGELDAEHATEPAVGLEEALDVPHDQQGLNSSNPWGPHLEQDTLRVAGIGGKGHGGQWIFVSHTPIKDNAISWKSFGDTIIIDNRFGVGGFSRESRLLHFKFEPMILHVMTDTLEVAHKIIRAALSSGFRESGIMNPVIPATLAIRTTGLAFDCIIGHYDTNEQKICPLVDDDYLQMLSKVAESRFTENERRRRLFLDSVRLLVTHSESTTNTLPPNWEDAETRKNRKRLEGLARRSELRELKESRLSPMATQELAEEEPLGLDQILAL